MANVLVETLSQVVYNSPTGQVDRRSSPFFYRSYRTVRWCAANTAGYMVRIVRFFRWGLAQLGEHYVRNVGVGGSTPLPSTNRFLYTVDYSKMNKMK